MKRLLTPAALALMAAMSMLITGTPSASAATSTTTPYTPAQVAAHNTAASCWTIVGSKVYDVTSWIAAHPGGPAAITGMCGKNATAAFTAQHGSTPKAQTALAGFQIGALAAGGTTVKPKTTITCALGSKQRKVTSVAPRCPKGWHKVVKKAAAKPTVKPTGDDRDDD